ncbi:leucine-rich repeat protein [uncultured Ruminococcus sp.]|uniref:leucine-rich repeat protein n=1 Tax=uncultured Ruminococcus sp. TaxID=165186 RepID=UPI0026043187|nr:leucine-rich repeat protein [uncultured Ruminococcus sp.]
MKAKRLLTILTAMTVIAAPVTVTADAGLFSPAAAYAASAEEYIIKTEYGYLHYTAENGEATITGYILTTEDIIPELVLPDEIEGMPVTAIGDDVFFNPKKVKGIVIPECVKKVGNGSFTSDSRSSLEWVRIENKEMVIPMNSGSFLSYLTIYGKKGSTAERYATRENLYFIDYEKIVTDGTFTGMIESNGPLSFVVLTRCDSSDENVVIPYSIDGYPVRTISSGVFCNNRSIKSVCIPDFVYIIGAYAFSGCTSLEEVRLPDGLDSIYEGAFNGCSSLREIELPQSLENLGNDVFANCTSLETVTIPESLTDIGKNAFRLTPWEESSRTDGMLIINGVLLDGQDFTGEELIIPDSVHRIADNAFARNKNIKSVVIPDTVEHMGSNCFSYCTSLETVAVPDGLTDLGHATFEGCSSLTEINIPEGITEIGSWCFAACASLKNIELPDSIRSIGFMAFEQCKGLEEISLPSCLEMIDMYAFSQCNSLKSVTLPPSLSYIGDNAFAQCSSLEEVILPAKTGMDIPRTAFTDTPWLEKLNENGGLIIINDMVFDGTACTGDLLIPEGVTTICSNAFYDSEITSVTLPSTLKSFGDGAFADCKKLEEFIIPDGFTEIPANMFSGCTSLKKVYIPDSVTVINSGAFNFCTGLTEFTVPKNVTDVYMSFQYCDRLQKIIFENPDCIIHGDSENFQAIPYCTTIYGYAGSNVFEYAYSNKKKFAELHHKGDANGDRQINVADLTVMQKWLLNADDTGINDFMAADINDDGETDVFDLISMRRLLLQGGGN